MFTRVKLVRKQPIGSMSLRQLADRTLRQRNEHKWKRLCNNYSTNTEGGVDGFHSPLFKTPPTDTVLTLKTSAPKKFKLVSSIANQRLCSTLSPWSRPISDALLFVVAMTWKHCCCCCGDSRTDEQEGRKVRGASSRSGFSYYHFFIF